jgi:hypothetical protein
MRTWRILHWSGIQKSGWRRKAKFLPPGRLRQAGSLSYIASRRSSAPSVRCPLSPLDEESVERCHMPHRILQLLNSCNS